MTKRSVFFSAQLILSVALVAFGLVACDGGDQDQEPLTLDAYVQTIVSLDQTHEGRVAPLRQELDQNFSGLSDNAPVPAEIRDTFRKLADEDGDFADAVADLNPPPVARDLHDEAVEALSADNNLVESILDDVDDDTTVGEFKARLSAQEVVDAGTRRKDACIALQEFANTHGVSVNMGC